MTGSLFPPAGLALLVLPLLLGGCNEAPGERGDRAFAAAPRTFSDEDKRVAAVLSLGAEADPNPDASPYTRALACKVAYDELAQRLSQPGLVNPEQRHAMEVAGGIFQQRLTSFAASAGKSSDEVRQDMAARQASAGGSQGNARVLIACLRKLQEDASR